MSPDQAYAFSQLARAFDGRKLDMLGGIADVRHRRDVYYGELDRGRMRELLARLAEHPDDPQSFERTFREVAGTFVYDYAYDPSRADWLSCFERAQGGAVMDYGAGLGNFALALAEASREVWAVDSTPERLEVIGQRARVGGKQNLFLLLADHPDELPFAPESFDLILLNGVLEWTAVGSGERADRFHEKFLRGLARYLKPGGSIIVAIENRYGLQHFLGDAEHNDFRFAALLPRALATAVNRLLKGEPYATYTYSRGALKALARGAGLKPGALYMAYPSYQQARLVIHEHTPYGQTINFLGNMLPHHSWKWRIYRRLWRLLAALGLARSLAPAYIIEAEKSL